MNGCFRYWIPYSLLFNTGIIVAGNFVAIHLPVNPDMKVGGVITAVASFANGLLFIYFPACMYENSLKAVRIIQKEGVSKEREFRLSGCGSISVLSGSFGIPDKVAMFTFIDHVIDKTVTLLLTLSSLE